MTKMQPVLYDQYYFRTRCFPWFDRYHILTFQLERLELWLLCSVECRLFDASSSWSVYAATIDNNLKQCGAISLRRGNQLPLAARSNCTHPNAGLLAPQRGRSLIIPPSCYVYPRWPPQLRRRTRTAFNKPLVAIRICIQKKPATALRPRLLTSNNYQWPQLLTIKKVTT